MRDGRAVVIKRTVFRAPWRDQSGWSVETMSVEAALMHNALRNAPHRLLSYEEAQRNGGG